MPQDRFNNEKKLPCYFKSLEALILQLFLDLLGELYIVSVLRMPPLISVCAIHSLAHGD